MRKVTITISAKHAKKICKVLTGPMSSGSHVGKFLIDIDVGPGGEPLGGSVEMTSKDDSKRKSRKATGKPAKKR